MNAQAAKNIRQAFPSIVFGSREWEVTQAAADWISGHGVRKLKGGHGVQVSQSGHGVQIDQILTQLDLLTIAQRCLIDGETLEAVGEAGPYGTAAQRRAWAAGRLAAACEAIHFAKALQDERRVAAERIAQLEKALAYARAETRAAARFKDIAVPFREPRKTRSVDWDAA